MQNFLSSSANTEALDDIRSTDRSRRRSVIVITSFLYWVELIGKDPIMLTKKVRMITEGKIKRSYFVTKSHQVASKK